MYLFDWLRRPLPSDKSIMASTETVVHLVSADLHVSNRRDLELESWTRQPLSRPSFGTPRKEGYQKPPPV